MTNPKDIADSFNDHFTNIRNSVSLNSFTNNSNWDYLSNFLSSKIPPNTTFTITPISESFVRNSLNHLPETKAAGLDRIGGYFLKIAATAISPALTKIFNLSINSASFPDLWKIAKVSPLFKSGSLFDRSNFRPISVLAVISKILERHVHNSFYHFLTEYNLLVENQFGFRTSRSCELAVTHLTDKILTNIDNKKLNGLLLVDFKKAFDLVDHEILILKLRMFGCSPLVLKWFTSYLSDHYQRTYFKNTLSDMRPVKVGVPQGSILGPLLFILFINDLPSQLSHSESTMFADDTTVLTEGSSIHDLNVKLNLVAQDLSTWTQQNRMVTNTLKTKTMLIHSPQQLKNTSDRSLSVTLNGNILAQVKQAKVLGLTLDEFLIWTKHIDNLCSTINSRLALLRRIKPFLTKDCALRFYNSCINSSLIYCSVTWGNCSKTLLLRILRLQKRAARIILHADFSTPSVLLFSQIRIIPIFDLVKFRKLLLLINILTNPSAPSSFKQMFKFLSSIRQRALTRACAYDLQPPFPRTDSGKRTFQYSASILFNCLDSDCKQLAASPSCSSYTNAKQKIRKIFLNKLNLTNHIEDLFCINCKYLLNCNCIHY